MRRGARRFAAVIGATVAVLAVGVTPGHAADTRLTTPLPSIDPRPGPGGCSVDIVTRGPGSYQNGRVSFSYGLAGRSCRGSVYGLLVLNRYDRTQSAAYTVLGDGRTPTASFDRRLPFRPTADPQGGVSGLCVVAFSTLRLSIADVAPNQPTLLRDLIAQPNCEPLVDTAVPGGARAFH